MIQMSILVFMFFVALVTFNVGYIWLMRREKETTKNYQYFAESNIGAVWVQGCKQIGLNPSRRLVYKSEPSPVLRRECEWMQVSIGEDGELCVEVNQ